MSNPPKDQDNQKHSQSDNTPEWGHMLDDYINAKSKKKKAEPREPEQEKTLTFRAVFYTATLGLILINFVWNKLTEDKQREHRTQRMLHEEQARKGVQDFYRHGDSVRKVWQESKTETSKDEPATEVKRNTLDSLTVKEPENTVDLDSFPLSQSFDQNKRDMVLEPVTCEPIVSDDAKALDVVGVGETAYMLPRFFSPNVA